MITGAGGVLGAAIARTLAAQGMSVVLVDVSADPLHALAEELGDQAMPLTVDVSDPSAVAEACKAAKDHFGPVNILVNNAGILSNNKIAETQPAEWRKVLAVNLDGPFYFMNALLPGMKERGWGRIVNMCSLASKTGGLTAGTAYTTSKGGLVALTFSAARESAARGVTVNGIAPAYVRTPMVTEQLSEEQRTALLADIPVGRFVEPEEIAHVVRFLVDPLSGFITGEIIDVNGGLHFD